MLCCVDYANDMFLRSWSMMFLVVLSFKAIFESNPERYERWLRLLQVACFFFVVDCFVLQQQICHSSTYGANTGSAELWRSTGMYAWAGGMFYVINRIDIYLG